MKIFLFFLLGVLSTPAWSANECAGTAYRQIGKSCAQLGLDSNRAVCRPGDRFALLCDDIRGGRVRTCQSHYRCDGADRHDRRFDDRGSRHGDRDRPYDRRHFDPYYDGNYFGDRRYDRRYDSRQQMELVRALRPEAVSLALRELCPDSSSEAEAGEFFRELVETGSWPQYILYSPAEAARFERLRQAGFFGTTAPFALFVLGRYSKSLRGDPAQLADFLATFEAGAFPWAVCCFGPAEAEAARLAASLGGHVRIGFENNQALPDGTLARDNAQLVAAELRVIGDSGASNRPLASAAWVRRQLAGTR